MHLQRAAVGKALLLSAAPVPAGDREVPGLGGRVLEPRWDYTVLHLWVWSL